MPPSEKKTSAQKRRKRALSRGVTSFASDFAYICKRKPDRIGIVAEGDSWFSYPRKWIAFGEDMNVLHHVEEQISGTKTANLLRLSSSGDEAVNMVSGKQKEKLAKIFRKNRDHIDIVLFSGGGNDIVGKRDLLPLLRDYQDGFDAIDCIHVERFTRKLDAIELAYDELGDLVDEHIPQAVIITHTYDISKPVDKGAKFFWGLIKTRPWIYPYLVERNIPESLHVPVVEYLLGNFRDRIIALAGKPEHQGKIQVVDTQGTLRVGHKQDWLNEIHPSKSGFKRIARKIYAAMKQQQPELPSW